MALITWDDSYSVKVDKIDGQHQKLMGLINQLHEAMKIIINPIIKILIIPEIFIKILPPPFYCF